MNWLIIILNSNNFFHQIHIQMHFILIDWCNRGNFFLHNYSYYIRKIPKPKVLRRSSSQNLSVPLPFTSTTRLQVPPDYNTFLNWFTLVCLPLRYFLIASYLPKFPVQKKFCPSFKLVRPSSNQQGIGVNNTACHSQISVGNEFISQIKNKRSNYQEHLTGSWTTKAQRDQFYIYFLKNSYWFTMKLSVVFFFIAIIGASNAIRSLIPVGYEYYNPLTFERLFVDKNSHQYRQAASPKDTAPMGETIELTPKPILTENKPKQSNASKGKNLFEKLSTYFRQNTKNHFNSCWVVINFENQDT